MSKLNSSIQDALITTLRTIVANDSVAVEFDQNCENNFFSWDQKIVSGGRVNLPDSSAKASSDDSINYLMNLMITACDRAAADLAASYILFHDAEIHQDHQFFNEFEKVRVIAQIADLYRGASQNILQKIDQDIAKTSNNFSMILLAEIFGDSTPKKVRKYADELQKGLDSKFVNKIKNLASKTSDQKDFNLALEDLLSMLESNKDSASEDSQLSQKNDDSASSNEENSEGQRQEEYSSGEEEAEGVSEKQPQKPEIKEDDKTGEVSLRLGKQEAEEDKIEFKKTYKIFSTKFDEVVFPPKMVSKNELESLRDQLEIRLKKLDGVSRAMSLKLKRKLMSKRDQFIEYDASRGILDRKKLVRIVTSPQNDDIWVNNKNHDYHDTCLTILLDNSGSMRGQPILMSALACEIIAEILEKFSVKTEIIGFTTADWKGGRVKKLWESSGRSPNPGRLNELRHIIYKHFNQKFKKAKTNLGLMLKEGILKENIDGEALLFARSRLMQQSEKRKILMVISDGTPVDDSTNSANDRDILIDHLHHVIKKIEKGKKIEIVGVGIGHATDEFYRNSTMIRSLDELGDAMISKIVSLI